MSASHVVNTLATLFSIDLTESPSDHSTFVFELGEISLYIEPAEVGVLVILATPSTDNQRSPDQALSALTLGDYAQGAPGPIHVTRSAIDGRPLAMMALTDTDARTLEHALATLFAFRQLGDPHTLIAEHYVG